MISAPLVKHQTDSLTNLKTDVSKVFEIECPFCFEYLKSPSEEMNEKVFRAHFRG